MAPRLLRVKGALEESVPFNHRGERCKKALGRVEVDALQKRTNLLEKNLNTSSSKILKTKPKSGPCYQKICTTFNNLGWH